jgi:membrane carboxypeptidase/penicillin-binding protein
MGFDLPAAGKTGTTDDYRDAWFTGFTPTLSVSIWVGYDRGISMRDVNGVGITGGRGAAPIWADFMIKATGGEPPREFTVPSNIRFETVDPVSGEIAGQWTRSPVKVALRSGQDTAAISVPPATNKADRPAVQTADELSTTKAGQPVVDEAGGPVIEAEDNSTIKEEDLPPE